MMDLSLVRATFPILGRSVASGKKLVYLDNAATTQKPLRVIEAVGRSYQSLNAINDPEGHYMARGVHATIEEGRQRVADFIHANPNEITFCRGTTEAINIVAGSLARTHIGKGDEILISGMEHHSNLVPWQMVCQTSGSRLAVIPINQRGELDMARFRALLGPRTKLIALVHTSNSLGTVNPVEEVIETAHRLSIPVLLDGAQTVAHEALDVHSLGCDFYAFSAHKLYGPTGIGVLFCKEEWIDRMVPLRGGCGSHSRVTFDGNTVQSGREKFDTGIANLCGIRGLEAAMDFVDEIGIQEIGQHLQELLDYGSHRLQTVPDLRIVGTSARKSGIISFTLGAIHPHDVGTFLDQDGIAVRTGHHCTLPVMQYFHIPGTVRASFAVYNTREEIDHLVDSLIRIKNYFDG